MWVPICVLFQGQGTLSLPFPLPLSCALAPASPQWPPAPASPALQGKVTRGTLWEQRRRMWFCGTDLGTFPQTYQLFPCEWSRYTQEQILMEFVWGKKKSYFVSSSDIFSRTQKDMTSAVSSHGPCVGVCGSSVSHT